MCETIAATCGEAEVASSPQILKGFPAVSPTAPPCEIAGGFAMRGDESRGVVSTVLSANPSQSSPAARAVAIQTTTARVAEKKRTTPKIAASRDCASDRV